MKLINKIENKIKREFNKKKYEYFMGRYLPKIDRRPVSETNKIYIFCPVWGSYLELLMSYALPSALQSGNIPKLLEEGYEIELYVYTDEEFEIKIDIPVHMRLVETSGVLVEVLADILTKHMKMCLENNAIMLWLPPDLIIGNFSWYNVVKLSEHKLEAIAVAHARVLINNFVKMKEVEDFKDGKVELSNPVLVRLAFENPFLDRVFDHHDENNTFQGMAVRRISENLYSVVHNLPSVCVLRPQRYDVDFFKEVKSLNMWDRTWAHSLVQQDRIKFVGSSDFYFSTELTRAEAVKSKPRKNLRYNDKYIGSFLHNQICNKIYCSWRAE